MHGGTLTFLLALVLTSQSLAETGVTEEWVVRVQGGERAARDIADDFDYIYAGQVRGFPDTYVLKKDQIPRNVRKRDFEQLAVRLAEDDRVVWAEQQERQLRLKRGYLVAPSVLQAPAADSRTRQKARTRRADLKVPPQDLFNDELWDQQWYLHDTRSEFSLPRLDLRVVPVWKLGVTGRNVRVTVLDDGIETRHEDLIANYDPEISYDLNDDDPDPTPRYASSVPNSHGTRCAGEIAMAANNGVCGVGVAFNSRIGGLRLLDGETETTMDRLEAEALNWAIDKVDIYSASWGPSDDGRTVEGPGRLAREALERGVREGRGGKGSIYVWAAGNGGGSGDDCNCDGYTSSVYTLSVGSASEHGQFPWYGERCASTLACTYSSGAYTDQMIVTTDLYDTCTVKHTGTSAAAPLAAGIIALVLEVNPSLTWRDVQHLVTYTAEMIPLADNIGWQINAAGLRTNPRFGFGLMNALALVQAASNWTNVPPWKHCTIEHAQGDNGTWFSSDVPALVHFLVSGSSCEVGGEKEEPVNFLEHVEVKASIGYPVRGALELFLTSPSGTKVQLLKRRPKDGSGQGFISWHFMSVHTWGETPHGRWTLQVRDANSSSGLSGQVRDCELLLHGTSEQPQHMKAGPRPYSTFQQAIPDTNPNLSPPSGNSIKREHAEPNSFQELRSRWMHRMNGFLQFLGLFSNENDESM